VNPPNSANATTLPSDSSRRKRRGRAVRSTPCDHSGPANVRASVCADITTAICASPSPRCWWSQTGKNCM